jgi:hypothetical protein
MTLAIGDVFELYPPTVNHKKYCLCLGQDQVGFTVCLFLNSEHKFERDLPCDCARFEMLPASDTKLTVVSLSNFLRFDDRRLKLYRAKHLGKITPDVAAEIVEFCRAGNAKGLNRLEREFIVSGLAKVL